MFKKTSIFILLAVLTAVIPRSVDRSSASDCSWNTRGTCQNYTNNQPLNNTNTAAAGNIFQQGQIMRTSNANCVFTATITWSAQGTNQAEVTVFNPNSQTEQLFSSGTQGVQNAPWIVPNMSYRFTLWNTANGQKTILSQIWVSGTGLNCTTPSTSLYYFGSPIMGQMTLTDNNAFCVGQTPTYFISAPGMQNQTGQWISTFNGNINFQHAITLDGNGRYSGSGALWSSGDIGHWKKQLTFLGGSQSLEFDVRNCGTTSTGQATIGNTNGQSNNSGTTYYDPYNNTLLGGNTTTNNYYDPNNNNLLSTGNNSNTYYNPYNNNLFNQTTGTAANNPSSNGNGNTYYDPYGNVPCLTSACPATFNNP